MCAMLYADAVPRRPATDDEVSMTTGDGIPHLAEKLNHLFATVPAPTRSGLYSNESAAQALAERGVTVSGVHISHLRSGRRDNPSARLLAALGELFGVPIGYFFDSTLEDNINAELQSLAALKDNRAKSLMLRAQGVSPQSMEHLEAILDRIRMIEGLDDDGANLSG
jgi:transcriptional regulator with XRE-family HTH domain